MSDFTEKWWHVKEYATALGISEDLNSKQSVWNGKSLALTSDQPIYVLHEIAHWRVAAPQRRSNPRFGLGDGFGRFTLLNKYAVLHEEFRAIVLQMKMADHFGIDFPDLGDFLDHNCNAVQLAQTWLCKHHFDDLTVVRTWKDSSKKYRRE